MAEYKQIHLYPVKNILKPRGSMKKESLGLSLLERLSNIFESWTGEKYADAPNTEDLIKIMEQNLHSETEAAWQAFMEKYGIEKFDKSK